MTGHCPIELVMVLEEEYDIAVSDEDAEKIRTVLIWLATLNTTNKHNPARDKILPFPGRRSLWLPQGRNYG